MIALDIQTFHQSRESSNVTGVIYVELESGAFPETGWSDFPVIILGWWAEALLQFGSSARREALWRFMDGPHSLTLTKAPSDFSGSPVAITQVNRSLLESAERVASYCEEHKMFSKDLETLKVNILRLKAKQAVQRTGANQSAHIEIRPSVAADFRS